LLLEKCDGTDQCADLSLASDELGCSCREDEFTCSCIEEKTCTKINGCIKKTYIINGFLQCPAGPFSGISLERIPYGSYGRVMLYRLRNISECINIGLPNCNPSSCYNSNFSFCGDEQCFSSHVICTSYISENDKSYGKGVFECADNSLIFQSQFCDGIIDCSDGSDEYINQRGFKCSKCATNHPGIKCNKCNLPQNNLYDDIAQCDDNSDLCWNGTDSCFHCLDNRLLISLKQVCDGVSDCYDMSDECLCEKYINSDACKRLFQSKNSTCIGNNELGNSSRSFDVDTNNTVVTCQTKLHTIQAVVCDGRPECRDYSDECNCANPPSFCSDPCHIYFPMGDRYCDGVADPAWMLINNSDCPQGFDESQCPTRFQCNASGRISIDILQMCDGKRDCDDNSDEMACENDRIFSSKTEMIDNAGVRTAFWIMAVIVFIGNTGVIITSTSYLKKKKVIDGLTFQHFIILNISVADFLMGMYLITIAVFNEVFSGFYGDIDHKWRSSLECSIIGSIAVISSEASCFLLVLLTAFRLVNVCRPVWALNASLLPWKLCVGGAWIMSLLLSILPDLNFMSEYFVHSVSFVSLFSEENSWEVGKLKQFVCRYKELSNLTQKAHENNLESIQIFLKSNFDEDVRLLGYYGATSVCLPRFYVLQGESAWEYTILIITIDFLCFLFILLGYVFILKRSHQSSENLRSNKSDKQYTTMQKRIARIIATDFFCWIPICITAYIVISGVVSFRSVKPLYGATAAFLLPINSALNPFLFSSLPDKLVQLCRHKNK